MTARQVASTAARSRSPATSHVGEHRVDRSVERPLDGVLDLLRRVRLRRDLLEEEAGEARVVAPPVVAVELRPALVGRQLVVERVLRPATGAAARAAGRRPRTRRCPGRAPGRAAASWTARQTPSPHSPTRTAPSRPGRVQHRLDVVDDAARSRYASGSVGPVRAAVAAPVVGDDPVVPAEVRDLALPLARVDDRRRRQEHDRRLARAEDLVGDAGRRRATAAKPVSVGQARAAARREPASRRRGRRRGHRVARPATR